MQCNATITSQETYLKMFHIHKFYFFCTTMTKQDTRQSYEIIYSQHMWLCTSPAYDTVHMRSIIIDIRLCMNGGHLSCSLSHTLSHTDIQADRQMDEQMTSQAFSGPKLLTRVCLTWYHIHSVTNFWVDEHSLLCCGTHVLVNTTRATVPALAHGETKTDAF